MADLSNRIDQIEKGFENRQLTKSMMDDSLRFDPDAYLDQLTKSMQRTRSLQRLEETRSKIDDLEYSQNLTQSQLDNLIKFTNKHLQKLCDAVILLQKDVEMLKKARIDQMCECEAEGLCCCGQCQCCCEECGEEEYEECGDCECCHCEHCHEE